MKSNSENATLYLAKVDHEAPRTVLCAGFARSGLGKVVRMVGKLGVPVADGDGDAKLAQDIGKQKPAALARAAEFDGRYPVWAMSAAKLKLDYQHIADQLRQPMLILPLRDPLGEMMELAAKQGREMTPDDLIARARALQKAFKELRELTIPQLYLSHNLIMREPKAAEAAIAAFVLGEQAAN